MGHGVVVRRAHGALLFVLVSSTLGCSGESEQGEQRPRGVDADVSDVTLGSDAGTHGGHGDAPVGHAHPALPAPVCSVLREHGCISCHQGQGKGGAPMSLAQPEDFRGQALDGSPMREKVLARVTDPVRPMPPPSSGMPALSSADRKVLEDWFAAGMPADEGPACSEGGEKTAEGPAWASGDFPEDECDYVLTVGAHELNGVPVADDPSGFPVPGEETTYHCFYEKVPWGDEVVQAIAVRANVETPDDLALVHHMQLSALGPDNQVSFMGAPRPEKGGVHLPCANPNGATVGTWGPGALNPVTVPADTGVLMPSGDDAYLELQVHYHNAKHLTGRRSRTSFDVCVTRKLRPNTAAVHTLGYENALASAVFAPLGREFQVPLDNRGNGVAVGLCTAKQRARVLSIAPHMHGLGRHAKVEVLRADGRVEVIHDQPFDFASQTSYLFDDLWIEPGEQIRTTCTWEPLRKIVFGFTSEDEMCFLTTLAYPAGALAGQGPEKGFASGELSCAGLGG